MSQHNSGGIFPSIQLHLGPFDRLMFAKCHGGLETGLGWFNNNNQAIFLRSGLTFPTVFNIYYIWGGCGSRLSGLAFLTVFYNFFIFEMSMRAVWVVYGSCWEMLSPPPPAGGRCCLRSASSTCGLLLSFWSTTSTQQDLGIFYQHGEYIWVEIDICVKYIDAFLKDQHRIKSVELTDTILNPIIQQWFWFIWCIFKIKFRYSSFPNRTREIFCGYLFH